MTKLIPIGLLTLNAWADPNRSSRRLGETEFKRNRKFSQEGLDSAKSRSTASLLLLSPPKSIRNNDSMTISLSKFESRLYYVTGGILVAYLRFEGRLAVP